MARNEVSTVGLEHSDGVITLKDFYYSSDRRRRISVDLDVGGHIVDDAFTRAQYDKLGPLKVFFILKKFFPKSQVKTERTRHGFHIIAVGEEIENIPVDKRIVIREMLGDDAQRLQNDKKKLSEGRFYAVDTLFMMKTGFDEVLGFSEQIDPVALPFASKIPAKKVR